MAEEEKEEEIVVKKSGDSRVLIMMVLCIAVIILTPAGVYYSMGAFINTAKEEVDNVESKNYHEVVMDDITVPAFKTMGKHFIQVQITVHVSNESLVGLFAESKDGAKSLVKVFTANTIDILRTRKIEELDGSIAQKKKLQNDIMRMMNDVKNELAPDKKGEIFRLYFSKYTIQ